MEPNTALPLVRRLESIAKLTEEERHALATLRMQVLEIGPDQDIVREGDRPSRCCLLLEGVACIYKVTGRGKRQISAFQLPGDVPDLQSLHLHFLDSSVGTITRCKVGFIWHTELRELCERFPGVANALWRSTLADAAVFREWITNVGQREALARLAHIFCETLVRTRAIGLTQDQTCPFPITQQNLAEATGMSTVHVNRTLKEIRAAGLLELGGGKLTIHDWNRLKEVGDFDPGYLHLKHPAELAA